MNQKILIDTLNSIRKISIQMVQCYVDEKQQQKAYKEIIEQEKKFAEQILNNAKEQQNQIENEQEQKTNNNTMQICQFNQTKQYLKNILKRVNITHVTHLLQNKVLGQKNEKKLFLSNLLEQSIIFCWYNLLLQQHKVKDFFQMCIQQKNPQFKDEIDKIFKINLLKIIQEKNSTEINSVNQQLVQLGKQVLKQQSDDFQERMINFEQICLKVVNDEEIDQLQLNSIPLQYFLRYSIQLIITSLDVFCRLYLIYNDDQNQIKVKNLWINKKLAFENDFPIFIHVKQNKVYYYLCLKIKLTENELEEKLSNLKRNSHKIQNNTQSPIKNKFQNSDNTQKEKNYFKDNIYQRKQQEKRKSNYQIRFEQKKTNNDKFQKNIYADLEEIDVNNNKNQITNKYELYTTQDEDFPTSKLNLLKNSIKNQNRINTEESLRSKTVQNKKFNKSIIDLKINNFDLNKEDKKKSKSKKKKMEKKVKIENKNGIFSYRRTNESLETQNIDKNQSKEQVGPKNDDYILKPNISKLIKKSNKFKSIREDTQQIQEIIKQYSNTSLENKNKSFFETYENFDHQIDKQLYEFSKNDQILSLCVRKQFKSPALENNRFLKKFNLKSNRGLQYRQTSDTPQYKRPDLFKDKSPLQDFRKQNSQNNYPQIDYLSKVNLQSNQTQTHKNL